MARGMSGVAMGIYGPEAGRIEMIEMIEMEIDWWFAVGADDANARQKFRMTKEYSVDVKTTHQTLVAIGLTWDDPKTDTLLVVVCANPGHCIYTTYRSRILYNIYVYLYTLYNNKLYIALRFKLLDGIGGRSANLAGACQALSGIVSSLLRKRLSMSEPLERTVCMYRFVTYVSWEFA